MLFVYPCKISLLFMSPASKDRDHVFALTVGLSVHLSDKNLTFKLKVISPLLNNGHNPSDGH